MPKSDEFQQRLGDILSSEQGLEVQEKYPELFEDVNMLFSEAVVEMDDMERLQQKSQVRAQSPTDTSSTPSERGASGELPAPADDANGGYGEDEPEVFQNEAGAAGGLEDGKSSKNTANASKEAPDLPDSRGSGSAPDEYENSPAGDDSKHSESAASGADASVSASQHGDGDNQAPEGSDVEQNPLGLSQSPEHSKQPSDESSGSDSAGSRPADAENAKSEVQESHGHGSDISGSAGQNDDQKDAQNELQDNFQDAEQDTDNEASKSAKDHQSDEIGSDSDSALDWQFDADADAESDADALKAKLRMCKEALRTAQSRARDLKVQTQRLEKFLKTNQSKLDRSQASLAASRAQQDIISLQVSRLREAVITSTPAEIDQQLESALPETHRQTFVLDAVQHAVQRLSEQAQRAESAERERQKIKDELEKAKEQADEFLSQLGAERQRGEQKDAIISQLVQFVESMQSNLREVSFSGCGDGNEEQEENESQSDLDRLKQLFTAPSLNQVFQTLQKCRAGLEAQIQQSAAEMAEFSQRMQEIQLTMQQMEQEKAQLASARDSLQQQLSDCREKAAAELAAAQKQLQAQQESSSKTEAKLTLDVQNAQQKQRMTNAKVDRLKAALREAEKAHLELVEQKKFTEQLEQFIEQQNSFFCQFAEQKAQRLADLARAFDAAQQDQLAALGGSLSKWGQDSLASAYQLASQGRAQQSEAQLFDACAAKKRTPPCMQSTGGAGSAGSHTGRQALLSPENTQINDLLSTLNADIDKLCAQSVVGGYPASSKANNQSIPTRVAGAEVANGALEGVIARANALLGSSAGVERALLNAQHTSGQHSSGQSSSGQHNSGNCNRENYSSGPYGNGQHNSTQTAQPAQPAQSAQSAQSAQLAQPVQSAQTAQNVRQNVRQNVSQEQAETIQQLPTLQSSDCLAAALRAEDGLRELFSYFEGCYRAFRRAQAQLAAQNEELREKAAILQYNLEGLQRQTATVISSARSQVKDLQAVLQARQGEVPVAVSEAQQAKALLAQQLEANLELKKRLTEAEANAEYLMQKLREQIRRGGACGASKQ